MGIVEILLTTVLPALLPVGTDALKQGAAQLFGSPQPRTFEQMVQWEQLGLEKMKAIAQLDTVVGQPSQWVVDLRGSARYVVVFLILIWAALAYAIHGEASMVVWMLENNEQVAHPTTLGMLAQSAVFFLLGDRLYSNLKGR